MSDLTIFKKALSELDAFLAEEIVTNRDRAGVIQAFEFTYELAWKAIQRKAADLGNPSIASPKGAFTFAIANAWIDRKREGDWIGMIKDRNLTSHTYQEALAREVVVRIADTYRAMFHDLVQKMDSSR